MKILLNRKPVTGPWGGGNLFVSNFCNYFNSEHSQVVHSLNNDIDVIFMQDPRPGDTGISINEIINYKNHFPNTKIVHRVNECDARKNTKHVDDMLRECSKYTDLTIFVSNWMKEYHLSRGWYSKISKVLINGINKEFYVKNNKIDNKKINIVTHHWSNNYLKGFDIYDKLDDFVKDNKEYTFTYIGRERGTFKNTIIVKPLYGKELGNELSKYDVYISASRNDPGPNHILESLRCNIPTYVHTEGGGCVEFAGTDYSYSNFNELTTILKKKNFIMNDINNLSTWNQAMKNLEKIINSEFKNER